MDIIVAIALVYLGAPIGALCLLVGVIGVFQKKQRWPIIVIGVGAVLLVLAIWMALALANTNFGL